MPRSNRPRRRAAPRPGSAKRSADQAPLDVERLANGGARREEHADGAWMVRQLSGAAATKSYLCPGCGQQIPPGTPHLVVWPDEPAIGAFGGVQDRRHWHRPCWTARRRGRR